MICLDTSFIIDFLKERKEAIEFMKKNTEEVFTTEVNVFEIFIGIYTKEDYEREEAIAIGFFNSIHVASSNGWGVKSAKILSVLIKDGNLIEENDCFIASIMLANGCERIITRNKKHFERIKGIKVISY